MAMGVNTSEFSYVAALKPLRPFYILSSIILGPASLG
jgi:hypothetical protein